MEKKSRYSMNFDLDTKKLEKFYPGKNWRKAYEDIREYLTGKEFIHVQGSGYHSKEELALLDVYECIQEMGEQFSWLEDSLYTIYATEIGDTYDFSESLRDACKQKEQNPQTYMQKAVERAARQAESQQEFINEEELDF